MRFDLSDTQQLLRNSAREFLEGEMPIVEVRRLMETDTAHDAGFWRKMAEQGWTGLHLSEDHGGAGLGLVELAVLLEEMGRALVPGPFFSTVVHAGTMLREAGAGSQVAAIARGERLAAVATPDRDGRALFVMDAAVADILVVVSADALRVVPRNEATVTAMPALDTTRKLYSVIVPSGAGEVIATGDAARAAVRRANLIATAALAAEMTGGMQRVLDMAVAYAKTRRQFGKPIGQFQAVQHMCADMYVWTEGSRAAAYHAAYAIEHDPASAEFAVSVAKAYASDGYRECGNRGIQVHGGMGFTWENDTHLYYRRAKASELAFGDATSHRERVAQLTIDPMTERGTAPH